MKNIKKDQINTIEMNRGGMFDHWEKEYTYNKNIYYVSTSGIIGRMPDQTNGIFEIKNELLLEERDLK